MKEFIESPMEKALSLRQSENTRQNALNEQHTKHLEHAFDQMQSDEVYKKAKGATAEADKLINLSDAAIKNPAAANALAMFAARYASGGQRINETEIKMLGGGSKDVLGRLEQIANTGASGTLTPENAAFMKKFIDVTSRSDRKNMDNVEHERAGSLSRNLGIPEAEAYSKLTGKQLSQDDSGHPQDSEAVKWAKSNPTDPRSAAILKANGM
jgi:hypothetical protein